MNKRLNLFFLVLFYSLSVFSQVKTDVSSIFSKAPAVFISKIEKTNISYEKGEILIESNIEAEKLIQVDKGQFWSDYYIYYNSFIEISDIKAEVKEPNSNKFKTLPATNIIRKDNYNESSFYDDSKVVQIVIPQTSKNSIIKVSYKEKYTYPYLFGINYLSSYIPVIHSEYSVSFPKEIEIIYKLYNAEKYKINFSESRKKNINTYTWIGDSIGFESIKYKDIDYFSSSYYAPHILLSIKSINNVNFLSDYKDQYKYYVKIMKELDVDYDTVFKGIVDSICQGKNSETEKLEAIYYFVQSKIKYIAIEGGMSGLVPENPVNVYNRRYGDCKGKSILLVTMLKQAGIKASLAWVGTRHYPYKFSDFPSLYNDNHMIVVAQLNNQDYFLDATELFLHYSLPSSFIQGKEALVGIDSVNCRIANIPNTPDILNFFSDNITFNIKSDTLIGDGVSKYTGYSKNDITGILIRYNDYKNNGTLKTLFNKNQDKAIVENINTTNIESRIDTLIIDYKIKIPSYIKVAGDRIFVNLNIEKKYQNKSIDTSEMVYNRYLDYAYIERLNYKLVIPDGYIAESIPGDVNIVFNNFGFNIYYRMNEKYISMYEEIYVKTPYIEIKDFYNWNQLVKEIMVSYNKTISLKLKPDENKN